MSEACLSHPATMDSNEFSMRDLEEDEFLFSEFMMLSAMQTAIIHYGMKNIPSLPMRTSALSCAKYTNELLSYGNDGRMKEILRMEKASFEALASW